MFISPFELWFAVINPLALLPLFLKRCAYGARDGGVPMGCGI